MMSYYKLVEMNNNGVRLSITNVTYSDNGQGGQKWNATARKEADGVALSIDHTDSDLDDCIDDIYQKWCRVTGQGMPEHKLNILEHKPSSKLPEGASRTGEGEDEDEDEAPLDRRSFDDKEIPF